jgi:hypothetical protein
MNPELCEYNIHGEGTNTNCWYSHSFSDTYNTNLSADLNIMGLYRGMFANDCAYSNSDPFVVLFNSLGTSVRNLPLNVMNSMVDSNNEGSSSQLQFRIRPPLHHILTNTSDNLGIILNDFFSNEGKQTFNCYRMSEAVVDVKNAVCVDIIAALYWYIGAWYICGFVICCCGIPAACLTYQSGKYISLTPPKNEDRDGNEAHEGDIGDISLSSKVYEQNAANYESISETENTITYSCITGEKEQRMSIITQTESNTYSEISLDINFTVIEPKINEALTSQEASSNTDSSNMDKREHFQV